MIRKTLAAISLSIVILLSAGSIPAYADAAPPQNPPGASVSTGKFETNVVMVSENVLMTIDDYTPVGEQLDYDVPPFIRGQVDATFIMQNQGQTEEAFDVWFPTGVETGYNEIATVDHFRAWVDGVEATQIGHQETTATWEKKLPWATWPASFPPGKQVTLRVTYDTYATGYPPYGRLIYILHSGAGWAGMIGEGTVTFRLPYDADPMNAAIEGGNDYWLPYGGPFTVDGPDIVWHFKDLEPTSKDDLGVVILRPAVWRKIAAARAAAAAAPGSLQAQLDLAKAAEEGLSRRRGIAEIGGSMQLVELAAGAYEAALKLDPENVDIYLDYMALLIDTFDSPSRRVDPRLETLLAQAEAIAPDDPRLADIALILQYNYGYATENAGLSGTATAYEFQIATGAVNATATADVMATLVEADRLGVGQAEAEPAPATRMPATTTPSPRPTVTPAPTAAPPGSANTGEWTTFVLPAVVGAIIAVVWWRRRSKTG